MSWVQAFLGCARLFLEAGWLIFFENIDGYHSEVSYKFAQCLDKDIVTFDTLNIELTKELIAEATGIPYDSEYWFKKFLLPLMHIITCFQIFLQTGVKEYISRISNQSGENH